MSKKGFTLVELLAVIVILAVILVIAVPKVLTTINDSRKSTFVSSAKLVAASAEKRKILNNLFEIDEDITCEKVANLNKFDYESCDITFYDDVAEVELVGKGKFSGINVNGTKTNVEVSDEEFKTAAEIIYELYENEDKLNNGLVETTATVSGSSVKTGLRYVGADPNNYAYFNCSPEDKNGNSFGSLDYEYNESNCEVWRIIGVFDVSSRINGEKVQKLKLVRNRFDDAMSWDSSAEDVNQGYGVNQWGSSGSFRGAKIMQLLNNYYLGKSKTCNYCDYIIQDECPMENDCTDNITPLNSIASRMVDNTVWNIGARTHSSKLSISTMYNAERGTTTGKICTSGTACTDKVERKVLWEGKVGLIYPTDYAYASSNASCTNDLYGDDSTCEVDNWLHPTDGDYWTIMPYSNKSFSVNVWGVSSVKSVVHFTAFEAKYIQPTVYLNPKVKIIGENDGSSSKPFILKGGV